MDFVKGQRVRVSFEGKVKNPDMRVGSVGIGCLTEILCDDGWTHLVCHNGDAIEPLEPASWPPQLGDIWETGGKEYYVRRHSMRDDNVICSFDGESSFYQSDLDAFKALSPRLVRRREV